MELYFIVDYDKLDIDSQRELLDELPVLHQQDIERNPNFLFLLAESEGESSYSNLVQAGMLKIDKEKPFIFHQNLKKNILAVHSQVPGLGKSWYITKQEHLRQ